MNYAVAVSTFFNDTILKNGRLESFKQSIDSLIENTPSTIFIVDDGSTIHPHLEYIESLNIDRVVMHRKTSNGGIARAKNTGIRLILENHDYGFLVDDDVLYKSKFWYLPYLHIMQTTNIQHLSFYDTSWFETKSQEFSVIPTNDVQLRVNRLVQGAMLAFSRRLIDKIGYFKIMPSKTGHEHTNFTNRACVSQMSIPYIDVLNSEELLSLIDFGGKNTTRLDKSKEHLNSKFLFDYKREECEE